MQNLFSIIQWSIPLENWGHVLLLLIVITKIFLMNERSAVLLSRVYGFVPFV